MSTNSHPIFFADRLPALNIALRSAMAIFGGYAIAALAAAALAAGLPLPRVDAVTLAIMLSFIVYLLAAMWVFAAATLLRAAAGLAAAAAVFGAWLWLASLPAGGAA